jgi:hypothetical protein
MVAPLHRLVALLCIASSLAFCWRGAWVVHDGRILEGLLALFAGVAFLHAGLELARLARTLDPGDV